MLALSTTLAAAAYLLVGQPAAHGAVRPPVPIAAPTPLICRGHIAVRWVGWDHRHHHHHHHHRR